jgi:hypothetical protein
MLALLNFALQVLCLTIAIVYACRSLLFRFFRPLEIKRGRRYAWIAVILSSLIEIWIVLFFAPWRFQNSGPLLYLPLAPLAFGLLGLAFWGVRGGRLPTGVNSLLRAQLVVGLTLWAIIGLPQWNRRRQILHLAAQHEAMVSRFRESAMKASNEYERREFLRYAQHEAASARNYRWTADHPGQRPPGEPSLE